MMFSLRDFIKKGFLNAVGKMADYQIILNATGYYEKGVLLEEDLAEINERIEQQNEVEKVVQDEFEIVECENAEEVKIINEIEENT